MGVGTFIQPDFEVQTEGTAYKDAIDNAVRVMARLAAMFAAHEQSTPNMTVRVDAGALFVSGAIVEKAAQNTGTITAPVTLPRIDRIVIDNATGVVSVVTGAEAASPSPPAIPDGKLPIAQVLLQTTTTVITNDMLTDERLPGLFGGAVAVEVYKAGDLYLTTTVYANGAAVAAALGYGTWANFGKGRILVGADVGTNIEGLSKDAACYVTWTNHGLVTGDTVVFSGITQAQWSAINGSHVITYTNANVFSIPVNTSGYTLVYDPVTDPGIYQDADFDVAEETGGSKTKDLAHIHTGPSHTHPMSGTIANPDHGAGTTLVQDGPTGAGGTGNTGSGGSAAQDVLNPYIVVYMWKRTA